jgi:uncharacterized membrane protein YfcA
MDLSHIITLLATGTVVGFASGLLGIGGAFIMTPMQFMVYTDMGLSADLAIKTAFGTSLLVVLPTAVSGAWRHHREKSVLWRAALVMGGVGLVFAFAGATLATHLSGTSLKLAFGIVIILVAIRTLTAREPQYKIEAVSKPWLWMVWAIPVGIVSGLFGIGGGVLIVPVLMLALRFEIHYAIGTSLAVIILTSIGGVIGYVINGIGVADRLPYSLGYVNLSSWLLLALPGAVMAQVGAMTAHKIPRRPLIYIFVVILLYMGLKLIGVFNWLGWPI